MSENNDRSRSDRKRDSTRNQSSQNTTSSSPARSWRAGREKTASNESFTRPEWEDLHSDPDARADLGYELTPWETIDTATDSKQVIFMPQNEELLKDDAFIVADEDVLCDLGKQY